MMPLIVYGRIDAERDARFRSFALRDANQAVAGRTHRFTWRYRLGEVDGNRAGPVPAIDEPYPRP